MGSRGMQWHAMTGAMAYHGNSLGLSWHALARYGHTLNHATWH